MAGQSLAHPTFTNRRVSEGTVDRSVRGPARREYASSEYSGASAASVPAASGFVATALSRLSTLLRIDPRVSTSDAGGDTGIVGEQSDSSVLYGSPHSCEIIVRQSPLPPLEAVNGIDGNPGLLGKLSLRPSEPAARRAALFGCHDASWEKTTTLGIFPLTRNCIAIYPNVRNKS